MASQSRKARGRRTEKVLAAYYAENGFPYAEPTGAGRSGIDITGMPGLAPEVKARSGFQPLAWLRQAASRAGLPFAVFRCNGQGEKSVEEWGVLMSVGEHTKLLRLAGFGDPLPEQHADGPQDQGKETQDDHALHPVLRSATDLTAAHDVKSATEEAHTD